ncbi:hypothetical protein B0T25DRAFT_577015 [Lasiosphaeria hispida]|uniref:Uncharacterized protein n=1 Tax=Lasiosphaeria hispida TaxID=260671 RepID=A0AAJ0HNY9_9PEZI|nr:hypothetical protein B0T25DRAFT_577015 [Lasiosphaeria hispida]
MASSCVGYEASVRSACPSGRARELSASKFTRSTEIHVVADIWAHMLVTGLNSLFDGLDIKLTFRIKKPSTCFIEPRVCFNKPTLRTSTDTSSHSHSAEIVGGVFALGVIGVLAYFFHRRYPPTTQPAQPITPYFPHP